MNFHAVKAIYRFESDLGCWPHDLNELVPDYLDGGVGSDAAHLNDSTDATNGVEIKDDSPYPRNPPQGW